MQIKGRLREVEMVQIVIRANSTEIASLVMALQGRRNEAGVQDVPNALRAVAKKLLQKSEGEESIPVKVESIFSSNLHNGKHPGSQEST